MPIGLPAVEQSPHPTGSRLVPPSSVTQRSSNMHSPLSHGLSSQIANSPPPMQRETGSHVSPSRHSESSSHGISMQYISVCDAYSREPGGHSLSLGIAMASAVARDRNSWNKIIYGTIDDPPTRIPGNALHFYLLSCEPFHGTEKTALFRLRSVFVS